MASNTWRNASALFALAKLYLSDPRAFRRLRHVQPGEERYARPVRSYELPPYDPGMRQSASNERYLRPTRFCDCRSPLIVALAHSLGAYQKPDREYANGAFEFVKEQLHLEICPIDGVEDTLRRGTGTCFQLNSVFIALCRAAGIKARYKTFSATAIQEWREAIVDVDPLIKKWYDSMGYSTAEGEAEAFVDGRWMVAHAGPNAERQASAGIPVTRFGEDGAGVWFWALPGSIRILESIPAGLGVGSRILYRIAPGSMERVNVGAQNQARNGRRKIEEAGGVAAYDAMARTRRGADLPTLRLGEIHEIVFEE
ncbi:MAG: transglutaminase domain-containing protein [candidate division NC10 bacterium]